MQVWLVPRFILFFLSCAFPPVWWACGLWGDKLDIAELYKGAGSQKTLLATPITLTGGKVSLPKCLQNGFSGIAKLFPGEYAPY